ncbi:MAG: c-type cytochrome [Acidimicrobiia bacterium]|nr:c-type cytochrome [Acidimicrobiia bacterium]NNL28641.1 c-type cytochrome [Acidimicrobiia bacterium]
MKGLLTPVVLAGVLAACGADTIAATPVDRGTELVQDLGCVVCHDGTRPELGPTWNGIWNESRVDINGSTVLVDADYIRSSINFPQQVIAGDYRGFMPPYALSDAEIADIAAFIETLTP